MPKIAIAFHSEAGHTRAQAEAAAEGAGQATLVPVEALQSSRIGPWVTLDEADAILFGAPTHMGSVSAPFEAFATATSSRWGILKWKDKLAAGFTSAANLSGDQMVALIRLSVLAAQHGMLWVPLGIIPSAPSAPCADPENLNRLGFYLGAGAQALPGEALPQSDLATARALGARVAKLVERSDG